MHLLELCKASLPARAWAAGWAVALEDICCAIADVPDIGSRCFARLADALGNALVLWNQSRRQTTLLDRWSDRLFAMPRQRRAIVRAGDVPVDMVRLPPDGARREELTVAVDYATASNLAIANEILRNCSCRNDDGACVDNGQCSHAIY